MTTHTPAQRAIPTDEPRIERRTKISYWTNDPYHAVGLLCQHGYLWENGRSAHEAGRLVKLGAICIVYKTGSILCQGSDPIPLIRLLDLAVDDGVHQFPAYDEAAQLVQRARVIDTLKQHGYTEVEIHSFDEYMRLERNGNVAVIYPDGIAIPRCSNAEGEALIQIVMRLEEELVDGLVAAHGGAL